MPVRFDAGNTTDSGLLDLPVPLTTSLSDHTSYA